MKKENGITITALIIYIIVMIMVLGVINVIINQFYQNTNSIEADTEEILEFNKFNTYFLKEVKSKGNKVLLMKIIYYLEQEIHFLYLVIKYTTIM